MRSVVLALGSNLGDSAETLQGAVDDLGAAAGLELLGVSSVYETDPVGGPEQPRYLNAVVLGRTSLEPSALLEVTQGIERAWHRVRDVRWGPRTLDIDIVAMGDLGVDAPDLQVPHPRAHERDFVLVPWAEVEPDAVIPGRGAVRELVGDAAGVRRTTIELRLRDRVEGAGS
jgi:2-amino-4-hydroxy-6-hydroxymethyldihydropteridine diphosphokinase